MFRGSLRARRSMSISISVTLDPFQASRWLPAASSSPIEVSDAVVAGEEEEDGEAGGGGGGKQRDPRPPMATGMLAVGAANSSRRSTVEDLFRGRSRRGGVESGGGGEGSGNVGKGAEEEEVGEGRRIPSL